MSSFNTVYFLVLFINILQMSDTFQYLSFPSDLLCLIWYSPGAFKLQQSTRFFSHICIVLHCWIHWNLFIYMWLIATLCYEIQSEVVCSFVIVSHDELTKNYYILRNINTELFLYAYSCILKCNNIEVHIYLLNVFVLGSKHQVDFLGHMEVVVLLFFSCFILLAIESKPDSFLIRDG